MLNIPLIKPDEKIQSEIALLVGKTMTLYQNYRNISSNTDKLHLLKAEIEKVEQQIDQEIYKLYGLTNEEIRTIEETE